MQWLKRIIEKIFKKNEVKLIEAPKNIVNSQKNKNEFIKDLKRNANLEIDDGNGYNISPKRRLKDMV